MAFLIGGANSAVSGYDIDNSCRFDDGSSPYLHRTPGSQGSLRKFTFSAWIKKTENTGGTTFQWLLHSGEADGDPAFGIGFRGDAFAMIDMSSSTYHIQLYSNALFRDPSAWYHMVVAVDTEQGTAANRVKVYMNNEQITSWATGTLPDEDHDLDGGLNKTSDATEIGRDIYDGGAAYIDGYISEVYFIDGTQYAPSDFGEADEDSGIWKPKDAKDDLTFGTNGFYLEFKESGVGTASTSTIGADTSGNTNHLTSSGIAATDQCVDTPTNNFATFNPLEPDVASGQTMTPLVYSEGNTKVAGQTSGTAYSFAISTIAVSSGKWYYEFYRPDSDSGTVICGAINTGLYDSSGLHSMTTSNGGGVAIRGSNGELYNDGSNSSVTNGTEYKDAGDILSVKLNMDDNEISFSTNGATYTSDVSLSSYVLSSGFVSPGANIGDDEELTVNFGNPNWALSSGNADANGYGNFEYAVPSGYFSLCSKNLAKYG